MRRSGFALALGGLLVLVLGAVRTAAAAQPAPLQSRSQYLPPGESVQYSQPGGCPPYLTLAPHGCGQSRPLAAQTYSYGWFGVPQRQQYHWWTDYYGYRWLSW